MRSDRRGVEEPIRGPVRKAPVLVLVHGTGCPGCREYLLRLGERGAEVEEWDGRITAIVPEASTDGTGLAEADPPFRVLVDPEQRLASALSIRPPAVAIADQWGEIHWVGEAGPEHRFPPPGEVVEWVAYLAVQCPECQGEAF